MVFWVTLPFGCWICYSSQLSSNLSFMSRSLAEAPAKACCASSSGSVAHVLPPLQLPDVCTVKPRLSANPQNHISPKPLCPLVPAAQCLTNWLTPYGLAHLDHLSHQYPVICHHLCLANSVQPSTLSNYSASCEGYTTPYNESPFPGHYW